MVIGEIMTENPASAPATATVADVVARLYELDVRHLPIVDGSQLVGIISDRDVRNVMVTSVDEAEVAAIRSKLEQPIAELMAADVVTVTPETDVSEAIDLMLDERIGAIPVVSADGELAGIVSYVDILRALQPLL